MRRSCVRQLFLGFALLWAALAAGTRLAVSQDFDEDEGLVLAFYHASYDLSSWSPQLCEQPEDLYDSSIPGVIDRHIDQARAAGLDAFVEAWSGPSVTQNPSETNLRTLLDRAAARDFRIAVQMDMTGSLLLTSAEVKAALIALRDGHTTHSAYLRIDGRPVIFFLGQNRLALTTWESLRSEVDPNLEMIWIAEGDPTAAPQNAAAILEFFNGLYLYDVQMTTQMSQLLANWAGEVRWWNLSNNDAAYWAATVIPGYDDLFLIEDEDDQLERARNAGRTYRDNFDAALNSDPNWIVIRSFNEWTTCTHIEPSVQGATTYLDLTAELVEGYRLSLVPPTPAPTVDAATPTVVVTATETVEPTLMATTSPVTATATVTPTATPTATPTPTLTPSATPFRLATPTPTATLAPGETRRPEPAGTPPSGVVAATSVSGGPGMVLPTMTPVPRLPVEGYPPRRCSMLPLLLPVMALLLRRRTLIR